MSTLDVVAEVLREVAPRALRAKEIAELAAGRLPTSSKTPETVVSRDLALDVLMTSSRFLRVGRGEFVLKHALPTALYNDNDAYATRWSRNLIEAGEIPRGVVDERSIKDLTPQDIASYRQFHAFSGLGTWARALRDAGWSEEWPVWSGSAPCQGMSQAGRRRGFADPRHLWPDWYRLIDAVRPPFIFGEQVASKDGLAWLDLVCPQLDRAGYTVGVVDICAAGIGAPHLRQRLYFVAVSREGGRQILREARLHDSRQPGDDIARRGEAHQCGVAGTLSDAERVVRDAGRSRQSHGRSEIESDRHGEAHGAHTGEADRRPIALGDSGFDRAGKHRRELLRDEAQHEERPAHGDHASVAPGAAHRPGDRIRLVDDPTWGGAVRGYWAEDVEWVYCRPAPGREDGCFRPARAGVAVLADGAAVQLAGTRAKRLRAIGNAIVLPQATEFVRAAIEACREWALQDVDALSTRRKRRQPARSLSRCLEEAAA